MSEYQKEREEEREGWVGGGLIGIWDKKNLLISLIYSLNLYFIKIRIRRSYRCYRYDDWVPSSHVLPLDLSLVL